MKRLVWIDDETQRVVPREAIDEMEVAAENHYEETGATFPDWKGGYRAMLAVAPAVEEVQPVMNGESIRTAVRDAIADAIGGDVYDCGRVWSAWGVGTMGSDNFAPIVDNEERLLEITDAAIGAARAALCSVGVTDEREAFEAWAKQEYKLPPDGLTRLSGGEYRYTGVSDAWAGWCAARAALSDADSGDDKRDAERYRWLRNPSQDVSLVLDKVVGETPISEDGLSGGYKHYEYRSGDDLDAKIDAAIAAASKEDSK